MDSVRARKWSWWKHLAKTKFFVDTLYKFTAWERFINCSSTGNSGQEVVRTAFGTVTWVPCDRRIAIASTSLDLFHRLCVVSEEWRPHTDQPQKYSTGKMPEPVRSYLENHTSNQGFQ